MIKLNSSGNIVPETIRGVEGVESKGDMRDVHEKISQRISHNLKQQSVFRKLDTERQFTPKNFRGVYTTKSGNFGLVYELSNPSRLITLYLNDEGDIYEIKGDGEWAEYTLDEYEGESMRIIPEIKTESVVVGQEKKERLYINGHFMGYLDVYFNSEYKEDSDNIYKILDARKKFISILDNTPLNNYHDGSMGSSGEMDKVTLVFEGGEEVTLDQAGTHGSNYAHSNTYEYEAEDTINQIAMIIAEKNKLPKMIRYSHESWDSWSGQRSERYEAEGEFSYEEVEGEIMAAAKGLGKGDDLIEIGNALIEDLEKNRIEEVKNRFVNLLMSPPVTDYHNGSLGESGEQDNVKLVFADGEEITLDQAGTHGSNYAHSNTYEYEAENTINQIAMIIAKKGEEPKQVYYGHSEHNSWEGSTHYSIKQEHTFEYKEVEREIMEAAKGLGKGDDLIEIGNSLIEDPEMSLEKLREHCIHVDSLVGEENKNYAIFEEFGHLGLNILAYTDSLEKQQNILKGVMRSYKKNGHGESTLIGALNGDEECEEIVSCWAAGDYDCEYKAKGFNSPAEYAKYLSSLDDNGVYTIK